MEPLREFLNAVRDNDAASGNFLGLLNILIGRRITRTDGTMVSGGMTWRELSALLKQLRWDREGLRELKVDAGNVIRRATASAFGTGHCSRRRGFRGGDGGGRPPYETA